MVSKHSFCIHQVDEQQLQTAAQNFDVFSRLTLVVDQALHVIVVEVALVSFHCHEERDNMDPGSQPQDVPEPLEEPTAFQRRTKLSYPDTLHLQASW